MRDTPSCRWRQWRVTIVDAPEEDQQSVQSFRRPLARAAGLTKRDESAGIRHELVSRVRREIEAGSYETEEKWLLAEDRLLDRLAGIR